MKEFQREAEKYLQHQSKSDEEERNLFLLLYPTKKKFLISHQMCEIKPPFPNYTYFVYVYMYLQVQHIEGKGRAVFATRCFQKGEYVVEYHGDLLQITDAKKREAEYALNPATGCYMYYFQYLCKTYW